MKRTLLALIISIVTIACANAQTDSIRGSVVADNGEPIIGASIVWQGTSIGAITDFDGNFAIRTTAVSNHLIVSYVSYETDTIEVTNYEPLNITLHEERAVLDEVELTGRAATTIASRVSALQTSKITGAELCRAACCNLSESFETNASVDVSFADAATGAKQIRLLGLSGTYVQLLSENTPGVRGLAQNFGLEYTPGVWMESIQVSKGTSSVINGYEATTGQINVEYLKPQLQDPLAINGMFSSNLRGELNITGGWAVNDKVSTGILAHYKNEFYEHDGTLHNNKSEAKGDGFMDLPKTQQVNLLNRWYIKTGNYTGQVLARALYDDRNGGQMASYGPDRYRIGLQTCRADAFMKHGWVFNEEKGTSIGLIFAGSYHDQNNIYGKRVYDASQGNFYFNGIFQTNFTDEHKLVTGLSLNYDIFTEELTTPNQTIGHDQLDRSEWTPGAFVEYSYMYKEKLSLLLGARADYSTRWGAFFTPRFNVRYAPWEWWNLRASVGMGYRSPNLLSDYASILPSSRTIEIHDANGNITTAKELQQERAVNAGISTTFYIPIAGRELQISADYYYTHFIENVVMDMDSYANKVIFSNLNGGRSYAGNFQVEATMEILKGWTMTLAYRMSDVKQTINGELRVKPLTNKFKGLITTSYVTPLKKWQFDVTAQFNGGGRMPDPDPDKADPLWSERFSWHPQLMAQVTKYFRTWSIYIGGENLTNFTQKDPIINAANPFSETFDASMAWGPLHGATAYIGFRWNLNRKE